MESNTIMNVAAHIQKYGDGFEFWPGLENELVQMSQRANPASYYAKNLLKQYKNYCFSVRAPLRVEADSKTGPSLIPIGGVADEASDNMFQVIPNPANEFVSISFVNASYEMGDVSLNIRNMYGQIIYSHKESINNNGVIISSRNWPSGTYLINAVFSDGSVYTDKLIVVK